MCQNIRNQYFLDNFTRFNQIIENYNKNLYLHNYASALTTTIER